MSNIDTNQLSAVLAENAGITEEEASRFLKSLAGVIADHVSRGEEVVVQGLGKFAVIDTQQSEMRRVAFIPSDALKNEVNSPFSFFEPYVIAKGAPIEKAEEEQEAEDVKESEDEANIEEDKVAEITEKEVETAEIQVPPSDGPKPKRQFCKSYLKHLFIVILKAIVPIFITYYIFALCDGDKHPESLQSSSTVNDSLKSDTTKAATDNAILPVIDIEIESLMTDLSGNPQTVKATTEDMLTRIAERTLGDKAFWPYLYWVNRDILPSPSSQLDSQQLRLPNRVYFHIDANDSASIAKAKEFGIRLLKE